MNEKQIDELVTGLYKYYISDSEEVNCIIDDLLDDLKKQLKELELIKNTGQIEILSYEKFVDACKYIASRIDTTKVKNIYGIPRGGIVPAVYISHLTGLPIIEEDHMSERTLVIDDIADSGQTLAVFNNYYKTATIYYHKQSIIEPDIWVYEKRDKWIQFPWENAL